MEPLSEFKEDILTLKGVHNKVGGDGDDHMKGIGCLLTGSRLHRGNIQGGGHTPAGWASGISIDQEISNSYNLTKQPKRDLDPLSLVWLYLTELIHGLGFRMPVQTSLLLRLMILNKCCRRCMGR